jgi:hypothetical protein
LTDTGDVNVLNFDIDYKINHIDIIYRDEDGDLLYWTDGLNPPRKVNVKTATTGGYGTIISSYLDVAKEPPSAPPYCAYENDDTITVNNLNNRQFKFKYRFVFDDLEKSVTSAQCEVPIPYNYTTQSSVQDPTNNSRIRLVLQTGPENVTRIEILGAESLGTNYSDFFLISVINKADLGLNSNDVFSYLFFNNEAYNQISLTESIQPFDIVPQKAYTQSLPNGNVLDYGAITEGYNPIILSGYLINSYPSPLAPFLYHSDNIYQNLMVVAYQNGQPAFGSGDIKIIIGGIPVNGETFTIYTTFANFSVSVVSGDTINSIATKVGISATAAGFTVISIVENVVLINEATASLEKIELTQAITSPSNNSTFIWDWSSKYGLGVVYFDEKGRTNGVMKIQNFIDLSSNPSNFVTRFWGKDILDSNKLVIPYVTLDINNRPPEWASYFQLVRTKNLTKSNWLYWISSRTEKDTISDILGYQYAYISISNLQTYALLNPQSKLSYEFVIGDRIKFIALYNGAGNVSQEYGDYNDYEIIDSLTNPVINGTTITGQVLKIILPPTSGSFNFGTGFSNYLIQLYTPASNFSNDLNLYYEFGEKYIIGDPGTPNAYHQGSLYNQDSTPGSSAGFLLRKGDCYFRYRNIPTGGYTKWGVSPLPQSGITVGLNSLISSTNVPTSLYTVNNTTATYGANSAQVTVTIPGASFKLRVKGNIRFTSSVSGTATSPGGQVKAFYSTSLAPPYTEEIIYDGPPIIANQLSIYNFDYVITVPTLTKYIRIGMEMRSGSNPVFDADAYISIEDTLTIYEGISDLNFSDNYDSSATPNGRAWSYDPNAAQEFNPTLIRFGGEYQAGTTVNQTNRFYEENFDLYDRSRGSIKKMFIEGRNQYIFQQFDVGVVTVLTQIVKDTAGNPLSAQSERLLNKIVYPYVGGYGIGDMPESFAYGKSSKYFIDSNKGVVCRLAANGITPLSIVYKTNAFFVEKIGTYKNNLPIPPLLGKPVIYGAFDAYTNKYMIAMEGIIDITDPLVPIQVQNAYTISFLESRDNKEGFESFLDYYPENMGALNNLFITYTGGQLWKHDNPVFCNFYNAQKSASITTIFNDAPLDKKSFLSIMETANTVWYCYNIESQLNSYGTVPQVTYINAARFALLEGQYYSAILRDANSPGGIINGDTIHGNYLKIVFKIDSANTFSYLNTVSLNYNNSPLNLR